MFDETSRSHTDDDSTRHIHRGHRPPEEKDCGGGQRGLLRRKLLLPLRRLHRPSRRSIPAGLPRSQSHPAAGRMRIPVRPTRNEVTVLLIVQAILSIAAFIQLWRTQMLPALYLVIIAALLVLFWLLVKRCQEYSAPARYPGCSRCSCVPFWRWAVSGRSRA